MTRFIRVSILAAIFLAVGAGFYSTAASAAPTQINMIQRGQCGGNASTANQLMSNWNVFGVTTQAAKVLRSAGYNPGDTSLPGWMKERVVHVPTARVSTTGNYGCNPGQLFGAGKKTLAKGHMVFATLPAKYSKSQIRLTPAKGYKAVLVMGYIVADGSCSNPHKGVVYFYIYVKVKKTGSKTKPCTTCKTSPPGCTITIVTSPGAQATCPGGTTVGSCNGVNNCNIITVWVTCGVVQIPFTGTDASSLYNQAVQWASINCTSPPVITPPCNCTTTPPPCNCTPAPQCVAPNQMIGNTCYAPCPSGYTRNTTTAQCDKNGTVGPGTGTPGPGTGTGAGGNPGTGTSPVCRDASGNIVPGTPDPVSGNCAGTTGGTTGGTTTPLPPPPTSMCLDPVTKLPRPGPKDQFGYCL